jgi:hypothetical protein
MAKHLEKFFPKLAASGYTITSLYDPSYNCFAFAAGDRENWWDPRRIGFTPSMRGFWYDDVPAEISLAAFVMAYQKHHGFEPCANGELEPGFEKIAIFVDESLLPTHAAKQLPNGKWMSKASVYEDFAHELGALEGRDSAEYGRVAAFLKRKVSSAL